MSIAGKVVIVTGASSGIGRATAKLLAKKGAKVVIAARHIKALNEVQAEMPAAEILPVQTDVTKMDEIQQLINQAQAKYGRIDVLFNNAGMMNLSMLSDGDPQEWSRELDINVKGVLNGIRAVLPIMKKQGNGHIITTDSIAGLNTWAGYAIYSGSKYAVRAIMESLRQEVAADHIKTTTLCPGVVATGLIHTNGDTRTKQIDPESAELMAHPKKDPLAILQPEDIAQAVAFAIDTPANMAVNEMVIRPVGQKD